MGISLKLIKYQTFFISELVGIFKFKELAEYKGKTIQAEYNYPKLNSKLQNYFRINCSFLAPPPLPSSTLLLSQGRKIN